MKAIRADNGGQSLAPSRNDLVVMVDRDRLKAACVARGWSLSELARQAKLSRPTISALVRGQPVRPQTAWKIGRALGNGLVPPELPSLLEAS
ncbi:MAG TPA: helix-turn-helix transcriptional regulator [Candidatus Dormibacteraeota bacterium]